MGESPESKVYMVGGDDPQMILAAKRARATFRYFWRELSWERRRIVPFLDLAAVKAPFSDSHTKPPNSPAAEQMWINEIDFDGRRITGVLLNQPNWLKSLKQGDSVSIPAKQMIDWMYVSLGVVHGAFTVNLLRSRMNPRERAQHDKAWGLDFGDPENIQIVAREQKKKAGGLLSSMFSRNQPISSETEQDLLSKEHPMSENMAGPLKEQLAQDPAMLHSTDDRGWTLLHQESLAGNLSPVKVLLDAGADPNVRTSDGITPLQLARVLSWDKVIQLLLSRGPK